MLITLEEKRQAESAAQGPTDAESALYEGFVNDTDRRETFKLKNQTFESIAELVHEGRLSFEDERLTELLFRMRARCAPETLNEPETERWLAECRRRLTQEGVGPITLEAYFEELDRVREDYEEHLSQGQISEERFAAVEATLEALYDWGEQAAEYAQL